MNTVEVSVVIPTYNRASHLCYTLESLRRQTLPTLLFEVIVIDDGGSDNSEDIVSEYKTWLNIKYLWQSDIGFRAGKARNIGTIMAEGKYIIYIDTGVLLSSAALQVHYDLHRKSKHPTVVIGYVYGFEVDHDVSLKMLDLLDYHDVDSSIVKLKELGANDIRQVQYDELGIDIHRWPAPFDIFWTCHVSAERDELIKAGLFDETFTSWGGEDVDLGVRLHLNKNIFIMNSHASSIHWPHEKHVEDHIVESRHAADKIHSKYNLWTTSFYGLNIDDEKYSLNKMINMFHKYVF